jgi:quercetin dioxygenase-like cupin family protein
VADRYEDDRGVIQDLLVQPLDSVTEIRTVRGAVRGNHTHQQTVQYTYVVSGRLRVATSDGGPTELAEYGPGEMFCDAPGVAHAWQALADTTVLVFTRGPRSGEAYESDTQRLAVPILS